MDMDIFADSDSDSAYDESSPSSTCDEPMEIDPPAGDSKPDDEAKPPRRKTFQEVSFPPNHPNRLDHRNQHEFVGAVTVDNKIILGMVILGMKAPSVNPKQPYQKGKLKYDVSLVELVNGDPAIYSLKEYSPKRNECFLLDKRVQMNSEVYHYSNPKRFGHVSAVELLADVYVPFLNRIVAKVPVTDDNYVLSINSNYWRSSPYVILGERRGRVADAAYIVCLRDRDGKKLKIYASVGSSHNRISRIRDNKAFSSPIVPGDRVRLAAIQRNFPPEWFDEEGIFAEGEEYTVDEITLHKIAIRWETNPIPQSTQRFGPYPVHPLTTFQEEIESKPKTPIAGSLKEMAEKTSFLQNHQVISYSWPGAAPVVAKKFFMEKPKTTETNEPEKVTKQEKSNIALDLEDAAIEFMMETAMKNIPGPSSESNFNVISSSVVIQLDDDDDEPSPEKAEPSKDSTPSSSDTASACIDSPTVKRRCPDRDLNNINIEWIDITDLQEHSLLPTRRDIVVGSRLKLLGEYELLTPETYYNRLIPEFEKLSKTTIPPLPSKGGDSIATFSEPVYGDVIMRHSTASVDWFDGITEHNINPIELHRARKLNHPTETSVYRNMLLKKEKTKKQRGDLNPINSPTKEFGLVTKVSQEKMLTVRWFKKEGTEENAPYIFQNEEIMSQYDNIKHHLHRIPLGAHVYYAANGRNPKNIYDCVAKISKMNEDGTQTIVYHDGTEVNVWPGQAIPLDGEFDFEIDGSFVALDDFYDDELPPMTDYYDNESLDSSSVPFLDIEFSSSSGSIPLGYSDGLMFDLHSIQSSAGLQIANLSAPVPLPTTLPSGAPSLASITFHSAFDSPNKPIGTITKSSAPTVAESVRSYRRARCYTTASLESRFIEFLKRNGDGYNTTRGVNYLAAVFLLLEPKFRKFQWFESNLAPHFDNFDGAFAEGTDLKDAYDLLHYTFNRDESDITRAAKAAIIERHPDYEAKIKELFSPLPNGNLLVTKLIYDLYKNNSNNSPIAIKIRHTFGDERDHGIIVVFPVIPIPEVKAWLDQVILEPETKSYYYRNKIVFSYISTEPFLNFKIPEGKGVYICHTNAHIVNAGFKKMSSDYWQRFETGEPQVMSGTLRNVQMYNDTRVACEHFIENKELVDTPNPPIDDDFEVVIRQIVRVDESQWKDHYHQAYYSKFGERIKHDDEKKDKTDRLDFNLEGLAETLNFVHNDVLPSSSTQNIPPDYFFRGELYPEYAMPRAIVLQVSPNLNSITITESFLVFQIISQIIDCPVWPDVTVHLHRECSNSGTLASNFALALILLRKAQLLSSPYFNIVEVQNLAEEMKEESFRMKGEYIGRFGLESVRLLRNILFKMCSLSCIKFWAKLNVIEQCFEISRLLDTVKLILNGGSAEVIPFKDLAKVAEECTDLELRDHLASIQLSIAPPPSNTQGTFKTLDAVTSHSFSSTVMREMRRDFVGTVKKEHKLLRENIPEGVHVVAFADRLDLLRAIIMGPVDTPYEGVPFLFDILLGPAYPQEPPRVKYVSLTSVAINPNLYTEGTVCLSLLGTWKGENHTMRWIPGTSNILQVVCSIQVEILMEACPYFNEPGFEARRNSEEGKKAAEQYNGQVLVGATEYFAEIMNSPPSDFADLLRDHSHTAPDYMQRLRSIMDGSLKSPFPIDLNDAVRLVVRRHLDRLDSAVKNIQESSPESKSSPDNEMPNLTEMFSTDSNKVLTMFSCGNPGSECSDLNSYIYLRRTIG